MRQFSIEEYLKNPSRKVVTRDGQSVKIHCTNFGSNSGQLIVAEIEGSGYSTTFFKNGKFFKSEETPLDLFFATEKREGWINLYKCENSTKCYTSSYPYDSEEKAIELGKMSDNYLKTVKIEWEA